MRDSSSFSVRLTESQADGLRSTTARAYARRRRNRHGRGARGELIPSHLPGFRSRSERFEEWVMESTQRLERLWGERIHDLQINVAEIPSGLEGMTPQTVRGLLGTCTPAVPGRPATITIYRHAVEMAAKGYVPPNELVHDAVVEQAAELMGMTPEAVDPAYGRSRA